MTEQKPTKGDLVLFIANTPQIWHRAAADKLMSGTIIQMSDVKRPILATDDGFVSTYPAGEPVEDSFLEDGSGHYPATVLFSPWWRVEGADPEAAPKL